MSSATGPSSAVAKQEKNAEGSPVPSGEFRLTDTSGKPVSIESLDLPTLNGVKEQLQQRRQYLVESFQVLRGSLERYHRSKQSLAALSPATQGKDILLPLTTSLYVPAKLGNVKSVMVNIGTGYYVEQSVPAAGNYLNRRAKLVEDKLTQLQQQIQSLENQLKQVIMVMQQKIQQTMASSAPPPKGK
eukprot:CAMPEP_0174233944 /NCGR_PEP_ID=MMETSP0417-20130205/3848_1 /TAXON_ID=242541 /ORGANISM="Mayorella sp, Strain BSH-02190019" /LENGTH=186 /DNA_ID=CAMNT_0015312241 /DNA_START=1571 /DNA_END=2131 /DNA_ORIENTATION=+